MTKPNAEAIEQANPGDVEREEAPPAAEDAAHEDGGDVETNATDDRIAALTSQMQALQAQLSAQAGQRAQEERTDTPPTSAPDPEEQALQQAWSQIANEAASLDAQIEALSPTDPVARALKVQKAALEATARATAMALRKIEMKAFLRDVPEPRREAFDVFLKANKHRFADLEGAFDAFDAVELRAERTKATEKVQSAEKVIAAKDRKVVATGERPVTAAERKARSPKEPLTEDQFDREYDRLREAGDFDGALALSRRYNAQMAG